MNPEIKSTEDFYCDYVLSGKVTVEKVRETDRVLAFYHTHPSYEKHIVIIPKEHVAKLIDVKDKTLIGEIFGIAEEIIREFGLDGTSYRLVTNGGANQESKHLHFHLVSGDRVNN